MSIPRHFLLKILLILSAFTFSLAKAEAVDLNDLIQSFAKSNEKVLRIPPGTYRLDSRGLSFVRVKDATIDATNVTLLGTSFTSPALLFSDCRNVRIRGLTLDYDPLPFTQGDVTAVNEQMGIVDFEIHAGYPTLTKNYQVLRFYLFEKDSPRWKKGCLDYYPDKLEVVSPTKGRFHFPPDRRYILNAVASGDRLVMTIRAAAGIMVSDGSSGLTFENCTIHAAPGLAVGVRFAETAGTFDRLRVAPGLPPTGATQPRLISSSADALNVAYSRQGPLITNCDFSFMGDDSLNIHGMLLPVLKWLDERTFLTMQPKAHAKLAWLVRPGDEVRLMEQPTYRIVETRKCQSIRRSDHPREEWLAKGQELLGPRLSKPEDMILFEITLDKNVSNPSLGLYADIPATSAPNFQVRDSYFHDHRARGMRLMSQGGIIENNRFERIQDVAISLGPEFEGWREAGWVQNITLRGNRLREIGQGGKVLLPASPVVGAISVGAITGPLPKGMTRYRGNEMIFIEGNQIDGCSVDGISVGSAKDVTIIGNSITNVNQGDGSLAGRDHGLFVGQAITLIDSDASLQGNIISPKKEVQPKP